MRRLFAEIKKKSLQQRLAEKIEEYETVNSQFRSVLDNVSELRLKRQAEHLASEIYKIEVELAGLDLSPDDSITAVSGRRAIWLIIVALLSIIGFAWLSWLFVAPDCRPPLIQFRVSSQERTGVVVIPDSRITASYSESLMVQAIINNQEPGNRSQYSCEWTYTGDGRIIAMVGCSLQLRVGQDQINDIVTLTINQQGCNTRYVETFFIVPAD